MMNKEIKISAGWIQGCIIAAFLYLLLPNVLFLYGWTVLPYALLAITGLCAVSIFLFLRREYCAELICSTWDILCLLMTLFVCFLVVESIGFHGHVPQMYDFIVRNPIYDTLARESWPIAHSDGRMFVYYLAYWLPAALALKSGVPFESATILFMWTFLGIALSACVLFIRLKGRVLVFFVALLVGGLGSDMFAAAFDERGAFIYPQWQLLYKACLVFRFSETFRCVPGGWLQFINTFNHAVPVLLFFSLLFSKRVSFFGILFAAALMTTFSPLVSVVLFPLLLVQFILQLRKGIYRTCIYSLLVTTGCVALLLADVSYFMMATGSGIHPIWQDSSLHLLPSFQLFRYGICITVCFIQFLLLYFLCKGRYHCSYVSWSLPIVFLLIMSIWIGMEGNNELLYKGVMVLWLYMALFIALNWRPAISWKRKLSIVIVLLSFSYTFKWDLSGRVVHYTWNPTLMRHNIQDDWHGTLIHPEHYWNSRFWAKDTKLPFMIKKASAPTLE